MTTIHQFSFTVKDDDGMTIAKFGRGDDYGLLGMKLEGSGAGYTRREWREIMDAMRAAGAQLGWYD